MNWTSLFSPKYRRTSALPSPTNSSLHSKYFHLCIKMTFLLCSCTDSPRWHPRSIIPIPRTKPSNYPSCIIHWPMSRSWPSHDLICRLWGAPVGISATGEAAAPPWPSRGAKGKETKERSRPAAGTWGSAGSQPCLCLLGLPAGEGNERLHAAVILHSHTAKSQHSLQGKHSNWKCSRCILQLYFSLIHRQDCHLKIRHCLNDRNKTQLFLTLNLFFFYHADEKLSIFWQNSQQ